MKKLRLLLLLIILVVSLTLPLNVSAQTYRFSLSQYEVEAYLNKDGTLDLRYYMVFENSASADAIDFIDVGLPVSKFSTSNVEATVNDQKITDITNSPYVQGIALGLGKNAIPRGQSGTVIMWVTRLTGVLFPYDQADRENYVNFQFSPNYFGSEYDKSTNTKYRMTIILPPDVGVNDGVYYTPSPWPGDGTPEASTTQDGRVYYSWYTEKANVHTYYQFGCAFPASAVPASSISTKEEYTQPTSIPGTSGGSSFLGSIFNSGNFCCLGFGGLFAAFIAWVMYQATAGAKKRKLAYLPPKIAIEGMGVKRGLTAVEAAILQEQPLDKVLTMILFGVLKKNAATVLQRDPLKLEVTEPLPEGLQEYEKGFLAAFKEQTADRRRTALQTMMVDLVKTTSTKMKGFSRKETNEYYKDISERAWKMVETAQTPEVKSESYDKTLEWTMLDKDFGERTQRTFTGTPVFLPMWWGRYDPVYRQSTTAGAPRPTGAPSTVSAPGVGGSKPSMSLPNIPGSNFAASMVNGMTGMAAGVIGSVSDFTSGITNRTNPIPVSSTSSGSGGFRGGGGGGHSCACACACAGCACACAGGGR